MELPGCDLDRSDHTADLRLDLELIGVGRQLGQRLFFLFDVLLRGLHVEITRVAELLREEQLFQSRFCGLDRFSGGGGVLQLGRGLLRGGQGTLGLIDGSLQRLEVVVVLVDNVLGIAQRRLCLHKRLIGRIELVLILLNCLCRCCIFLRKLQFVLQSCNIRFCLCFSLVVGVELIICCLHIFSIFRGRLSTERCG